jgi:hypothetical protein
VSGSHYKLVCEQCGGVIAQCRCMSCDKAVVVKGLCAKCAAQPQDKGSAGQQSASPCNNARDEIAALANELEDFNSRRVAPYGRITEIVAKMRQLSPVA